jgi:hypothetical protein
MLRLFGIAVFCSCIAIAADESNGQNAWWMTAYAGASRLEKRNKTLSTQVTVSFSVGCFEGAGTSVPIRSGDLKLCVQKAESNDFFRTTCSDWSTVSRSCSMDSGGRFTGYSYLYTGSYYVAVYLPPYALQWWDGKAISEQPTPVQITGDDFFKWDIHFTRGCRLDGTVSIVQDSSRGNSGTSVSLYDTTGIALFSTNTSGNFTFEGIPIGTYYLRCSSYPEFENPFYPGTPFADGAQRLVFSEPGARRTGISWTVRPKSIVSSQTDTSGHLVITHADTGYSSIAVVRRFVGTSRVNYSSTSNDTLRQTVAANQKLLIARANNVTTPQTMSLTYYPGSPLRSEAETLSLERNELRVLAFPAVPRGRITGHLPGSHFADVSFCPVLLAPGSYMSLCAEPYTDTTGFFTLEAPQGTYSLWFIPMTTNYFRAQSGPGAFRADSVAVVNNRTSSLYSLPSMVRNQAIEGTVSALLDPVLVCYDSLSRPMSMTVLAVNECLRDRTLGRWSCFAYSKIFAPPYTLRFALNSLPPGKYAIVKAEPPDSQPGPFSVSWFGGPTFKMSILAVDDVASLRIPAGVRWVTVDAASAVVDIGAWGETSARNGGKPAVRAPESPKIRMVKNKIVVAFPDRVSRATIRIFTAAGRLIAEQTEYQIRQGTVAIPLRVPAAQVLFVNVRAGERLSVDKIFR